MTTPSSFKKKKKNPPKRQRGASVAAARPVTGNFTWHRSPFYLTAASSPCNGLIRIRQGQGGGKGRRWRGSSGDPGAWYCFKDRRRGPSCPSLRTATLIRGIGGHGGGSGDAASPLLGTRDGVPEAHLGRE
nr:uncharacterized protein LOC129012577 [Pongo pygmaeus]